MNRYSLAKEVEPEVYSVFEKLTKGCDEEKVTAVINKTYELAKVKTFERALADALEIYKLSGAVNA